MCPRISDEPLVPIITFLERYVVDTVAIRSDAINSFHDKLRSRD